MSPSCGRALHRVATSSACGRILLVMSYAVADRGRMQGSAAPNRLRDSSCSLSKSSKACQRQRRQSNSASIRRQKLWRGRKVDTDPYPTSNMYCPVCLDGKYARQGCHPAVISMTLLLKTLWRSLQTSFRTSPIRQFETGAMQYTSSGWSFQGR